MIDPRVPAFIYSDPGLGKIASVQLVDPEDALQYAPKTLYIVNHFAPKRSIEYQNWGEFGIVYLNNYILGFVNNAIIIASGISRGDRSDISVTSKNLLALLAQKYVGEQLYYLGDSEIARVLFLEAVFVGEQFWRKAIEAKKQDRSIEMMSTAINHLTADYLTFHEFGHVGSEDRRFAPFVEQTIADLEKIEHFSEWRGEDRKLIIEEITSDIFAVNTTFARHGHWMSAHSLVRYLDAVVTVICRFFVAMELVKDLHRANVDANFDVSTVGAEILRWFHRERAIRGYIHHFEFGVDTIVPASADELPAFELDDDILAEITEITSMVRPFDEQAFRMAKLVSCGFEAGKSFYEVIEQSRVSYRFDRSL